jgi:hypothetical protein
MCELIFVVSALHVILCSRSEGPYDCFLLLNVSFSSCSRDSPALQHSSCNASRPDARAEVDSQSVIWVVQCSSFQFFFDKL